MISLQNIRRGLRSGKPRSRGRRGAVVVLAAILMVFMLAMVAFVVDVGYLVSAKTEMQRTADAAALAAAGKMANDISYNLMSDGTEALDVDGAARDMAATLAAQNKVISTTPTLDMLADITVDISPNNKEGTVEVQVRYTGDQNEPIPFFFAPIMNIYSQDMSVEATAEFKIGNVDGFRAPRENTPSTLMPFTIKGEDWEDLLDGTQGTDEWAYDPETGTVSPGQDGIREMRMFPERQENKGKGKGGVGITPGNFGTVDIGDRGNGAPDLWRQIINGPNADDFSHYDNGVLQLDPETGKLLLNGDTGMTASMGDHALKYVTGDPKTIFLYESVEGQGNNTWFTVTGFAGVRVMSYSMHGNDKYVLIQPAMVGDSSAIHGDTDTTSDFVAPTIQLVR